MKKTGNLYRNFILGFCLLSGPFADAEIHAGIDRSEVPLDESITLKISEPGEDTPLNPKFDAPDFEIMNQFENSQFQAVYVNGKFENKSERSISYILRPMKVGALKIRNIVNGSDHAPDITVQVVQDNAYKHSVSGETPKLNGDQKNFFVRGEVSKSRIYKGEQLIVSYYIYRRTRVTIRDVMQYPSFEGFIREDLEMPILSGRPDFEAVSLGGIPFERALLARYALYPIREGKIKVDGLNIRADYIPRTQNNDDLMEDPFFQFFTQVTPRTATSKSDPITVEVAPLPDEGKTSAFTGGVGNFEVSANLDPSTIKAYSPLTLRVAVKGKGNTSLIEFPPVNWPKNLKLYESQGKSKNLGQGSTEKTFEVVIVPQEKGQAEIPAIEFEFFNPDSRTYVRKKTSPISIQVSEGDPNSAPVQKPDTNGDSVDNSAPDKGKTEAKETFGEIRQKSSPQADSPSTFLGQPWWRWVAWFGLLVLMCFVGLVFWDEAKKRSLARLDLIKRRQGMESWWSDLQREAQELSKSNARAAQFSETMEKVVEQLYQSLDEAFSISSRALAQRDLAKTLTETHLVTREQWLSIASILEFSETVRFASSAGIISDQEAQQRTPEMIQTAQKLCAEISSKKG